MGPMTYEMLRAGEQDIGGMVPLDAAHGIPSHWIGYLGVADVDAACAKADAIGGKTCVPPTDIPGVGRFAVVEDSTGAVFSPFRGTGEAPPEPRNPPAGTFAWNELMTTDPAKAAEFYGALTGWTHERMEMPTGTYWLFKRGDAFAAGMMQMPPDAPSRPNWLPYVAVADCDASAATVPELGGQLFVQPTDIRDWGRFAVAQDPTGAVFAMLQSRPM
jgi:predicted enzyme related to lactoylglutathione lyase